MVYSVSAKLLKGFTLLEVIIYLALFSVLMTSVIMVVYQLLNSVRITEHHLALRSEGDFIIEKLEAALAGTASLSLLDPLTLKIVRRDQGADSPILFSEKEGAWFLTRGVGKATRLTSPGVVVHDLSLQLDGSSGKLTIIFWLDDQVFYITWYDYT